MTKNRSARLSILSVLGLMLVSACVSLTVHAGQSPPTLIIHGGNVLTMDKKQSQFRAIAITDDKITALGSEAEILALQGPRTEVVKLSPQAAVMPGFVEPHTHPDISIAMNLDPFVYNISPIDHFAVAKAEDPKARYRHQLDYHKDLLTKIREKISQADPDNGLAIFGWDPMFYGNAECADPPCPGNLPWLDDPQTTPKAAIDKAFFPRGEQPIPIAILLQSMHTLYANQAWIGKYGVAGACAKLKSLDNPRLCRKKANDFIGRFEEAAGVKAAFGDYMPRQRNKHPRKFAHALQRSTEKMFGAYHRAGISTVGVPGINPKEEIALLPAGHGRLRMGLFLAGKVGPAGKAGQEADSREVSAFPDTFFDHQWMRRLGTKFWYDGAPYSGSMFMDCERQQYYWVDWLSDQLGIPQYTDPPSKPNNCGHHTYPDK